LVSRLRLPCLDTTTKWKYAVTLFAKDLQFVQNEYTEKKDNPPLARNLPPTSGSIAWSRQLYRRIEVPISTFQKNKKVMEFPETKKAIKHYNRLARVLVEYEVVFLQIWSQQIDAAKSSLNTTVLVRQPDNKELVVNYDRKIPQVLREIEVLTQMGLQLPPQAKTFTGKKAELRKKYDTIEVSLPF